MKFNNRNVHVSPDTKVGTNVKIGDNVTIYSNVEICDNTTICNDSVIGEPLAAYYSGKTYENPQTVIGPDSLIRSHSIIYAGCIIGKMFSTGHRVTIRENTSIGSHCAIGTLSDIQGNVKMGNYCRLHSNVHISQKCILGDFVFMYPFSVMTNDPLPPSEEIIGGYIGDYTQVAVHAIILPGVRVGKHCLIGANSVVTRRIPDFSLATGDPARVVKDIREYKVIGKGRPYPWIKRFRRGMPWQELGYELWKENQDEGNNT